MMIFEEEKKPLQIITRLNGNVVRTIVTTRIERRKEAQRSYRW